MNTFMLLAEPLWVNVLLLVPLFLFWYYSKHRLAISKSQLLKAAIFGIAFGFVEAAVVVYLRAALGFLPGYMGALSDVIQQSSSNYQQIQGLSNLPRSLLTVEFFREIATIVVLMSVALLSAKKAKEQFAFFVWTFAFWDIFYYVSLWLTVRWPQSFTTGDVLFLIPTPWIAEVWFPLVVSGLTILAVLLNRRNSVRS